jgi:hypothetical protein
MSKLKNPHAKKAASYAKDRRSASSTTGAPKRKLLPRAKARTERAYRHKVHEAIAVAPKVRSEEEVERVEVAIGDAREKRVSGFRKPPDVPLGEVVEEKVKRRRQRGG